jgi:thiol-disulfide isomerase/thioredoxin
MRTVPVASLVLLAAARLAYAGGDFNVGDSAPPLQLKGFLKGDPVKRLEKGKIHVVEFWATWCPPCVASAPHLTQLQKKYKDVVFIGVDVWEPDPGAARKFVERMGTKMDYRIAVDDLPDGSQFGEAGMSKTWLIAAGQRHIPRAFIIDGEGRLAWVGEPQNMDKPLEEIRAGTWDLATAAKAFREETAGTRKLMAAEKRLENAAGKPEEELAIIERLFSEDPQLESLLGQRKFQVLAQTKAGVDKAYQYGERLLTSVFSDSAQALNALAWSVVDPENKSGRDSKLVKLALRAAKRADELAKGKDGAIADTLSLAYFDDGNIAAAVETAERALSLSKGTPLEESVKLHLEQFGKGSKKE